MIELLTYIVLVLIIFFILYRADTVIKQLNKMEIENSNLKSELKIRTSKYNDLVQLYKKVLIEKKRFETKVKKGK